MKKAAIWSVIALCIIFVLVLLGGLLAPEMIDSREFKSILERKATEELACPVEIKGSISLSLFPWAGIRTEDVFLKSLPGFEEEYIIRVKFFETHVRVLPFFFSFFKNIQVKGFLLDGVAIVLEKDKKGRANWEMIGKRSSLEGFQKDTAKKIPDVTEVAKGFSLEALSVEDFAISDGSILWIDQTENKRFTVRNFNLRVDDVALDRPAHVVGSAVVDGHDMSFEGSAGPVGKTPGKNPVSLDFILKAFHQIEAQVQGNISNVGAVPTYDLALNIPRFSLHKLMSAMGRNFSLKTTDSNALDRITFRSNFKGDMNRVTLTNGELSLDGSKLNFSAGVTDFSSPDIKFDASLDHMDLNAYLPPRSDKKASPESDQEKPPAVKQRKADYQPFRNLLLDGSLRIGELKVDKIRMQDIQLRVTGKKGVFQIEPFGLRLYQGNMDMIGTLDMREDNLKGNLKIKANHIDSESVMRDFMRKDLMKGSLNFDMTLKSRGETTSNIKKLLNGNGVIWVQDGIFKGIDLAGMVRNTDGAYGLSATARKDPQTPFTAFSIPFVIKNGVVYTEETRITSELFYARAAGKIDLVNESLDLRIEPTVVTTGKRDLEMMKKSEKMFPVKVSGTFKSPKFSPDLKAIAKEKLENKILESKEFKKIFEKEGLKPLEEDVKDLLEGLFQ